MIMKGKFRVCDTWQGVSQDGKNTPRASVVMIDCQEGGQVKVSFPSGHVPPEFVPDALLEDLKVKPSNNKFGQMLSYVSLNGAKPGK
jgi:hypothetical protein